LSVFEDSRAMEELCVAELSAEGEDCDPPLPRGLPPSLCKILVLVETVLMTRIPRRNPVRPDPGSVVGDDTVPVTVTGKYGMIPVSVTTE
jgi:hypothetical protein